MNTISEFKTICSLLKSVKKSSRFMEEHLCDNKVRSVFSTRKNKHKLISVNEPKVPEKIMKTDEKSSCKIDLDQIKNSISSKFNVTFESVPIKSESDKKEYLVMKLSNGLTALLISDVENLIDLSEHDCTNEVSLSDAESDGSDMDSNDSDSVKTSADNDESDSNKKEKLAACALTVGVGSFSDPETIPGLAHFLEHMVFMGSKKFPKENDFDAYISTRGGSTNASTECEYTSFYFDCPDKHLSNSMDRFANFFVSPLMMRDSMSREREAVESEFKLNMSSDSCRMEQLFCSTAPSYNPAHKFMWGNLITLQKNVSDDVLYDSLREFWSKNYSANLMTVAVQARLPLDILGIWVAQYFGEIPNTNAVFNAVPYVFPPFKMDLFNKIYTVMPVKDTNHLQLTWSFPSVLPLYKSKPLSYLAYLIGHEGDGSLLSYLQEKLWALQISAGCNDGGIENNSMYSLFSIDIYLTDEGLNNYSQIVRLVFSYLKLLKNAGPSEALFKEAQNIDELEFRFQQEAEASDYVEGLTINMQLYPPVDYLVGDKLLFEYKPDEIVTIQDMMIPENVNIMILSKSAAEKVILDRTEPWFKTKYKLEDIPNDWLSEWQNCEVDPNLFLPRPNIYIPSDFCIIPASPNPPEYPKNIIKNKYMEVWYKQDVKFKLPYGYVKIYLISPIASSTPQNLVMCNTFISLFNLLIIKETYPASLAGLKYSLSLGDNGLVLKVSGFSHKISLLLNKVLTELVSFVRNKHIPSGLFKAVIEQQRRSYHNQTLKASKLANDLRLSILCTNFWGSVSKLEAVPSVTLLKCVDFYENLFENLYIKCLIQGNISETQAASISQDIKNIINHKPLLSGTYPRFQTRVLPIGENIIRVQSFSIQDTNCNVTNYYQCGLNNVLDSCKIEILMLIMEEPLFDTLRTQEQLAYEVSCEIKDTLGVLGFTVTVKSQADKFKVEYVENRISIFINKLKDDLKNMTVDAFEQIKESLKILKLQEDTHLKDDVQRNWSEIISDEYVFDRIKKEVKVIEKINLSDLNEYVMSVMDDCENDTNNYVKTCLRKLSVQVDAEGHPITETAVVKDVIGKDESDADFSELWQIKKSNDDSNRKFIKDIDLFRSKLFLYPHRITRPM